MPEPQEQLNREELVAPPQLDLDKIELVEVSGDGEHESDDMKILQDRQAALQEQKHKLAVKQSADLDKRKASESRKKIALMCVCIPVALVVGYFIIMFVSSAMHNMPSLPPSHPSGYYPNQPQISAFDQWADKLSTHGSALERVGSVLAPFAGISVALGAGLFLYARYKRRRYLHFDKIGMLISDSPNHGEGDARFIPWGCLTAVDVIYPGSPEDLGPMPDPKPTPEALKNPTVSFYVDDGSLVQVPWQDIIACTEPGAFVNALKTWAPDSIATCKFPGEEEIGKIDKTAYTQLWFKYYSKASERKRTTYLNQGDTLQGGRFTISGQLGGGGQGTAYLAVDKQPAVNQPQEIVLKEYILPVHRGEHVLQQTVEKLKREADILRRINHPNIVKMLGEFTEDHRGYLMMEYVAGNQLKALVASEGPQPEKYVRELALQLCEIMSYLHGLNPPVIHRDLTPDNLILQDDGLVKLVDFNVAHQLESAATATVVGKHCYIPPEQFRGRPTPQSDIYAFGCTLYYLLTGEEPEPLTASHPKQKNPAISQSMDTLIALCTELDTNRRIANAQELKNVLESMVEVKT